MEYVRAEWLPNEPNYELEDLFDYFIFNEKFFVSDKIDKDTLKKDILSNFNQNVQIDYVKTELTINEFMFRTNNSTDLILLGFLLKDINSKSIFIKF